VWVRTPGGGGYGDPLERPSHAVFEDVRLKRYSAAQAKDLYGVVLDDDVNPTGVDESATNQLRNEMKRQH